MTPSDGHDVDALAAQLRLGIGLLVRRMRETPVAGELTLSETSALARLDRGGPATASALAKLEQISPQSIGATLQSLQERGLVRRAAHPDDGRRIVLSLTPAGREMLQARRTARTARLAEALASAFTEQELAQLSDALPLIERLAQSM